MTTCPPDETPALEAARDIADTSIDAVKDELKDYLWDLMSASDLGRFVRVKIPFDLAEAGADWAKSLVKVDEARLQYNHGSYSDSLHVTAAKFEALGATFGFMSVIAGAGVAPPFVAAAGGFAAAGLAFGLTAPLIEEMADIIDGQQGGRDTDCTPPQPFPTGGFSNPPVSPLVIDLNGDGFSLTETPGSRIHFDLAADGIAERTGWVLPTDGFLAYDVNSNGLIENGRELFGTSTVNGFEVLAYYDGRTGGNYFTDNSGGTLNPTYVDGVIDSNDAIFSSLKVWIDADQDGVTDSGELHTLASLGISSIDLGYTTSTLEVSGHEVRQLSTTAGAGGAKSVGDVWFTVDQTHTVQDGPTNPADSGLPELHGFGQIKTLHQEMYLDAGLAQAVREFIDDADGLRTPALLERFQDILFKWASVESAAPRGDYIDPKIIAFMEKAHNGDYLQYAGTNEGTGNPGPNAGAILTEAFEVATGNLLVKFLSQVTMYNLSRFDETHDFISTKFDALFSSFLYNPATDGFSFNSFEFALAIETFDLSDPSQRADAEDLIALLPIVRAALDADETEFIDELHDAFYEAGANDAIPLLDGTQFDPEYYNWGKDNGIAEFSDLRHETHFLTSGATIAKNEAVNAVYVVGEDLGTVTVEADAGVDRIQLTSGLSSATREYSYNASTGTVTIEFVGAGTALILNDYFANSQYRLEEFHPVSGELLTTQFIGDEIKFADGQSISPEGLASILAAAQGGGSADTLIGTPVTEQLDGQDGNDSISARQGDDLLNGGDGNDTIFGGAGDDVINGGEGSDLLGDPSSILSSQNDGDDIYIVDIGDGHDTIADAVGDNELHLDGVDSDDIILTRSGSDLIIEFDGRADDSIRLKGQFNYEVIDKLVMDDATWSAAKLADEYTLRQVSTGADTVQGLAESETMSGGAGDDDIYGAPNRFGDGDVFLYRTGDDADRIIANYAASFDVVRFLDAALGDATISRSGNDAIIDFGGGDSATLVNQFGSTSGSVVERLEFTDVNWSAGRLTYATSSFASSPTVLGDSGANSLSGTSGADVFDGDAGDDTLSGGAGGDLYYFAAGDGNDRIVESGLAASREVDVLRLSVDPDDVYFSRVGADVTVTLKSSGESVTLKSFFSSASSTTTNSENSIDIVEFDTAEAWDTAQIAAAAWFRGTSGDDTITGTTGRDGLGGGAGDDLLNGGVSDDTYYFEAGEGHDSISETGGNGDNDRVVFLDAVLADFEVLLTGSNGEPPSITFSRTGTTDSVTILKSNEIEFVQFSDGMVKTRNELELLGTYRGSSGSDTIYASGNSDVIVGEEGDDTIWGGGSSDLYVWSRYDGDDTIRDHGDAGAVDTLQLLDIEQGFVSLERRDTIDSFGGAVYDLVVKIERLNDEDDVEEIVVAKQYDDALSNDGDGIERIIFADGTSWDVVEIARRAPVRGTSGADGLEGSWYGETLIGGAGDDGLYGKFGDDVYVWAPGDGNDEISMTSSGDDSEDTLLLKGVLPQEVEIEAGDDCILVVMPGHDATITLYGMGLSEEYAVQFIKFENGVIWDFQDILSRITVGGGSGGDQLNGDGGANALNGGEGADTIYGGLGNDTIVGGVDDDELNGEGGADRYIYNSGDGSDFIWDADTNPEESPTDIDVLELVGLDQSDVVISQDLYDLLITVTATSEVIRVSGQFGYRVDGQGLASNGVERIVFDDGVLSSRDAIETAAGFVHVSPLIEGTPGADTLVGDYGVNTILGHAGNDSLSGEGLTDTLNGGGGADVIDGGDDSDVVIAEAGDGDDTIIGGDGYDTYDLSALTTGITVDLSGGAETVSGAGADTISSIESFYTGEGADTLTAGSATGASFMAGGGNDRLIGDAGDDGLDGQDGDDYLQGGGGMDVLYGSGGDDTLVAGTGDDIVYGDAGSDVYRFSLGDGLDYLGDSGPGTDVDVLDLGSGITPLDISFSNITYDSVTMLIGSSGDGIGLSDQLRGDGAGVDEIRFNGGPTWTAADLRAEILASQISASDDDIIGSGYGEQISALGGDDTVGAGQGDDTIEGGAGTDFLYGGAGSDRFVFADIAHSPDTSARDTLGDFTPSEDLIDLSQIDANSTVGGNQAFTFIGTAAFSSTAGQLRVDDTDPDKIFIIGDVNGDAVGDFSIEITGKPSMSAADFAL